MPCGGWNSDLRVSINEYCSFLSISLSVCMSLCLYIPLVAPQSSRPSSDRFNSQNLRHSDYNIIDYPHSLLQPAAFQVQSSHSSADTILHMSSQNVVLSTMPISIHQSFCTRPIIALHTNRWYAFAGEQRILGLCSECYYSYAANQGNAAT